MAYDQKLADRSREVIAFTHSDVVEEAMFDGLCFMVNDKNVRVGVKRKD
jgi:hypothetical protein